MREVSGSKISEISRTELSMIEEESVKVMAMADAE